MTPGELDREHVVGDEYLLYLPWIRNRISNIKRTVGWYRIEYCHQNVSSRFILCFVSVPVPITKTFLCLKFFNYFIFMKGIACFFKVLKKANCFSNLSLGRILF